ncbi:MAG: pyrroloquinoline quinone biosynthesis protein PqqE [Alphaproteobacteria bacterium]
MNVDPPLALLAELTHRCPLRCAYCSNPLELDRASAELSTADWVRVMQEAAALGCLQVHLSGGEPAVRKDLVEIVQAASAAGLYGNLITSGLLLDKARLVALKEAGLSHIQLSIQDVEAGASDHMAGLKGSFEKKHAFAKEVLEIGFAFTVNTVLTRHNVDRLPQIIQQAVDMGAGRLELAHTQYYGWGLKNRAALMPTRAQVDKAARITDQAITDLKGKLVIDHVVPDYYAARPKACMGGWARRFFNVTPSGKVLPCHAAETIEHLSFPSVLERSLKEIWHDSPAFNAYRGTDWMPEPCQSCERRDVDFGGCRCQALALAGDAAAVDPACALSPDHDVMASFTSQIDDSSDNDLTYRSFTV